MQLIIDIATGFVWLALISVALLSVAFSGWAIGISALGK